MQEFRDKVAVITGGASGIGLAMAERFAREGMKLDIKLSQEELGNMLGATRESTNKALRFLQDRRIITYDRRGHIIVADMKKLELMVQGEEMN